MTGSRSSCRQCSEDPLENSTTIYTLCKWPNAAKGKRQITECSETHMYTNNDHKKLNITSKKCNATLCIGFQCKQLRYIFENFITKNSRTSERNAHVWLRVNHGMSKTWLCQTNHSLAQPSIIQCYTFNTVWTNSYKTICISISCETSNGI